MQTATAPELTADVASGVRVVADTGEAAMGCFRHLLSAPRYKTEVPANGVGRLAVPSLNCIIAVNPKNTINKVIKCLVLCELMFVCATCCGGGQALAASVSMLTPFILTSSILRVPVQIQSAWRCSSSCCRVHPVGEADIWMANLIAIIGRRFDNRTILTGSRL